MNDSLKSTKEPLLGASKRQFQFIHNQNVTTWTEQQVLAFLHRLNLDTVLNSELRNGKQLCEMSYEDILTLAKKATKINDKMYDPVAAAKKVFGAIQAVRDNDEERLKKFLNNEVAIDVETRGVSSSASLDEGAFPPLLARPSRLALLTMLCVTALVLSCLFAFPEQLKDNDETVGEFRIRLLKFASIPITMVPFTYFHIWLALWMTFYPVFFVGCYQIPGTNMGFPAGWQGIVPFKSVKMAKMAVEMITSKLVTVKEVFSRLNPAECAQILKPPLALQMSTAIRTTLQSIISPGSHESVRDSGDVASASATPDVGNSSFLGRLVPYDLIASQAVNDIPKVVEALFEDLAEEIEDCFDLEGMVIKVLVEDMEMCNDIFIKVSHKELAFIRNAGAWMGGIFGCVQMILWAYFRDWWVLPLLGFIVGAITNWFALLLIFRPIFPIPIFGGRIVLQVMTSVSSSSWTNFHPQHR